MVCYETLFLVVPEITGDEAKSIEKELNSLIKNASGTVVSFERWGKYRLAYPVKKNEYGVYFLARFEVDSACSLPKDVASLCKVKLNTIVMREITSRLGADASLVYQRPPSLEDEPTRDVRAFLRENKMEGLLSPVDDENRSDSKQGDIMAKDASEMGDSLEDTQGAREE